LTKVGIFDVDESFNITGRGIVLVGYARDYIPRTGMFISIRIYEKKEVFKIIGVNMGNIPKDNKMQFGLLLQITAGLAKYISENKIRNRVAEILIG